MPSHLARCLLLFCLPLAGCVTGKSEARLDNHVVQGMERTGAQGLAIAIIRNGAVTQVRTWGKRNARGEPLTPETVMYGASLTKAVFAYTVMQLVEEGKLDLDTSIAAYLPKPLPEYTGEAKKYAAWEHLSGDERWRSLTPRILLTHSAGFSNFGLLEPVGKLRFHFAPGSHYAYSSSGFVMCKR
jgi:CubicO group peptidase (beta-lactamase class C family)